MTFTFVTYYCTFFSPQEKALGRELFEQVCKTLGIREVWYYGLLYTDAKGYKAWLRDDKRVSGKSG